MTLLNANTDFLQGFLFNDADVRGKVIRVNHSIALIMQQHDYPAFIRAILGELLVASILISSTLKYEGQLTLQFQSQSALKMLVAKCNHHLEIRGLAQWDNDVDPKQLRDAFFSGQLVITLEETRDKQRYQSIVAIENKTIAQAIEMYFIQSEQIPTKIILGKDGPSFAGLLLQKMPSQNTHAIDFWQHVATLAHTLKPQELMQWDNATLLTRLFHQENIRLFAPEPIIFKCCCSHEKVQNTLCLLGQEEALATFSTHKVLTVTCDYCNKSEEFTQQEVRQLFH